MKKPLFLVLLLAAAVLLLPLAVSACSDLDGTAAIMPSLSGSTTSDTTPELASGSTLSSAASIPGATTAATSAPAATTGATAAPPAPSPTPTSPPATISPPYVPTTRLEDDYSGLAWGGTWVSVGDPSDSGGSSRFAQAAGTSMKVYFTGMSIRFITRTGPAVGLVDIELDGVYQGTLNLYSPGWGYQQTMYSSGSLGPGEHILKVIVVGTADPASASPGIYVDAFDILGFGM